MARKRRRRVVAFLAILMGGAGLGLGVTRIEDGGWEPVTMLAAGSLVLFGALTALVVRSRPSDVIVAPGTLDHPSGRVVAGRPRPPAEPPAPPPAKKRKKPAKKAPKRKPTNYIPPERASRDGYIPLDDL